MNHSAKKCCLFLLPLVVGMVGCQQFLQARSALRLGPEPMQPQSNLAPRTLDSEFEALLARVERRVSRFAADQSLLAAGNAIAAAALEHAVQTEVGQFRQADDSASGLIDLWSYFHRLQDSLTSGADRDQFGAAQARALRVVQRNLQDVVDLATQVLTPERFEQIETEITEHAEANPLVSVVAEPDAPAFSAFDVGSALVSQLVALPGEAFDRLNPTSGLSKAGNRFADVAEQLPANTRVQIEELLEDLPDYPIVVRLMDNLDRLTNLVEQLQATARELPKQVSTESQAVLEQFGAQQPELQKTLEATGQTIAGAQQALESAQKTTESITQLTQALQETIHATDQLAARFEQPQASDGSAPTGVAEDPPTPFDIRDYQATAEALSETSRELRGLLGDVQALLTQIESPESAARLQREVDLVLGQTDGRLRGVVDHAAWRLAQLCGLVFVLFVAYRLLAWCFRRSPQETTNR